MCESWKPFYFGVKGQGHEAQKLPVWVFALLWVLACSSGVVVVARMMMRRLKTFAWVRSRCWLSRWRSPHTDHQPARPPTISDHQPARPPASETTHQLRPPASKTTHQPHYNIGHCQLPEKVFDRLLMLETTTAVCLDGTAAKSRQLGQR